MTFAYPVVLLALLLLPLLTGLKVWGDARSRNAAGRVASPRLLADLLVQRGKGRDWLVLLLEVGALACFIVALARPQYGFLEEETGAGGRSLIVAIDTSRSMLTDDLKPNRLTRTQLAATDLVKRLRGDRIGLMPFAGTAFMYAPITPDIDALLESIDSLDTEIIPRGGSNLARPIDLAVETFAKAKAEGQQVLILFSDGENLEGTTLEAAKRAKEKKLTIITIGVGTQSGALIPDPEASGGFYKDSDGKPVVSRLQRDVLISIANATGGLYLPLDEKGVSDRRLDMILEKLERTAMKGKITKKSLDRYRWPLGAGLLLLAGAWITGIARRHRGGASSGRSTAAVAAFLTLGFLADPGSLLAAAETKAKTKSEAELPVGNPWEFYQAGNYEASLHNFEKRLAPDDERPVPATGDPALEFGRGAAAFKNKDYDAAADAFGSAVLADRIDLRAQAHYNLANSIYQRAGAIAKLAKPKQLAKLSFYDGLIKQLENSLENYQQALVLDPEQEDFKANHDTTDELIQKLRKIRQQVAEGQGKGKQKGKDKGKGKCKGEGDGEGEGDDGEEGSEGGKQSKGAKPDESEEEKAAREKSNEEKEGKIEGQNPGGDKPEGEEPGGEKSGENGEGGEPDETEEADNEINPETGFSAAEDFDHVTIPPLPFPVGVGRLGSRGCPDRSTPDLRYLRPHHRSGAAGGVILSDQWTGGRGGSLSAKHRTAGPDD